MGSRADEVVFEENKYAHRHQNSPHFKSWRSLLNGFSNPSLWSKRASKYAFYLYTLKIFFHSRREIKERLNNHSVEVTTETHLWTRNGIREERPGSRTDLNQRWVEMLTRKYRSRKYTFSAYSPPFRRCSRLKIFHLLNKSNLTRTSKSWFVSSPCLPVSMTT